MSGPARPPAHIRAWRFYSRHGARRTAQRIRDQLRRPAPTPQAALHSHLPSSGLEEIRPGEIYGFLDTPQDGAIESSATLIVTGWACAPDGVSAVRSFIDGIEAGTVRRGLPRSDVAEYLPRIADAGMSGYVAELPVGELTRGAHLLELVVEDSAGHRSISKLVFHTVEDDELYDAYYRAQELSVARQHELQRELRSGTAVDIDVWLFIPAGADAGDIRVTVTSLLEQSHPATSCRVIADEDGAVAVRRLVAELASDKSDLFDFVAPGSFAALESSAGRYGAVIQPGEVLSRHALIQLAARAASDAPDVIYSDRDEMDGDGRHRNPWFNPDWSPDYLLCRDYVGGVFLFRDELRVGVADAIDLSGNPAWRYDLLLRLTDDQARVAHVPSVLWSRRTAGAGNAAEGAHAALDDELQAAQAALDRRAPGATVETTGTAGIRRVRWPVAAGEPLVSIVVPTTGKLAYVEPLLRSIAMTAYPSYELVVLDNSRGGNPEGIAMLRDHGARVIERNEDFNWAKLNNDGAREARGDLLLFLNDDIEIVDPDWLTELVGQALRPDVGTVGGLLLYPDGRIQHAGVFFVGYGGGAVHLFMGMDPDDDLYLDLQRVQREVSAVTGACLMVRRTTFEEAGGFDERLAIAGNDVDLCLRLARAGMRTIWTPHCRLVHHESASRRDTNISRDETTMWQLWGDFLRAGDPFHSPHFAKDRVDCALDARNISIGGRGGIRHPAGVNVIGYVRAEMGVGQAARSSLAALQAASAPFVAVDYQYGNPSRMGDASWSAWESERAVFDVNLVHINADLVPEAFARLPEGTFDGRYTIGHWTWELPEFPDDWLRSFAHVNEVWVPSTFVQQAVAAKSPVPVVRVPYSITAPTGPFLGRSALGLPEDRFLFLMMYDFYSVRRRKNPEGAIDAFLRAFAADNTSVGLVIKMNNADRSERSLLDAMIDGRPNIHVIDRVLTRAEVDSLIEATDCFVSLHRAEGFGLAIAEAMALGKPAIATYWSGNVDFMTPWNSAPVKYELVTLDEDYGPYRAGQTWAEPDLDHAAWWMRELAGDGQSSSNLGAAARFTIAREFSPEAVGRLITKRLAHVQVRAGHGVN